MIEVTRSAITEMGMDNTPFNIEFFYDQTADNVWLLEINPRGSASHSNLFEKVNGVSHQSIMVDLALGRKPGLMEKAGPFNVAAKFMIRAFEDGRVTSVPSPEMYQELEARMPDALYLLGVTPGLALSDIPNQDSYSYEVAQLFLGGRDQAEVLDKYDQALDIMKIEIVKETMIEVR